MSKRRRRNKKKNVQPAAGALPLQVGSGGVGHPPGTLVPPQRFPSGCSDFRPPVMNRTHCFDLRFNPRGFHPQNFAECQRYPPGIHPRFPNGPPGFMGGPSGYGPPEFRTGPHVPPEFRPGPPGYMPSEFRPGPPGCFPSDFRPGFPGCVPPEFRPGPPGFVPPEFQDRPPGFFPADRLQDFHQPVFGGRPDLPVMNSAYEPVTVRTNKDMVSDQLTTTQQKSQQTKSNDNKGKNGSGENCTTKDSSAKTDGFIVTSALKSAKPPPGRFTGVITFIDTNYGLIKGEDQKEFPFSCQAFFGNADHLIVGVKVHFTIVKNMDTECAADVKVAPGGTETIDDTIYEGVVTAALPDKCIPSDYSGVIRTILDTEPIKLPFGVYDSKCTLLLYDWVKFQLLTNILTKTKRATNITPQMPKTFQLTKEVRETGVIATIQNDNFTLISKKHGNLSGSIREFISDQKLKVEDDVEFAFCSKGSAKAIRLIKVPKKESLQEKSADLKPKWKPISSAVVAQEGEEISSECYEGTVLQVIPKSSRNLEPEVEPQAAQGQVEFTMMGTKMCLPFISGDVISQATMMVGDKVEFNIATKVKTREMHAINVEISPETFHTESKEQRKIGVVIQLDANSGIIKSQHYTKLSFDQSEVLEDTKLTLSEKVEFTIAVNEGTEKSDHAIRIRRLKESVFTSMPKIEEKQEKKKMTIKLTTNLNELVEEQVKTERKTELLSSENQAVKSVVVSKKEDKSKDKDRERNMDGSQDKIRDKARERSRERSRRRHSRSSSRGRDSRNYKRQRSSSRDRSSRSQRQSGSHSRDRSRNYSRSRSRERCSQSHRQRSHSPDYREKHRSRRRSRSPDHNTSRKTKEMSPYAPGAETVDGELLKKRNELLALNELIARRKAIIAMEQSSLTCTDSLKLERQSELSHSWLPEQKPVKSILKKHSEAATVLQNEVKKNNSAELEEYEKNYVSSLSLSPDSEAPWLSQSSKTELEDPELMRKKKHLRDLSESIARKRAILAMEQNAKKIKIEYYDGDEEEEEKDNSEGTKTWIPKNKSNQHPKKSILKTRSGALDGSSQKDMTPADQYDRDHTLFSFSQSLEDDYSASIKSSEPPCTQSRKSHSRSPSTPNLFQKRLSKVSSQSRADSPFDNQAGQQSCPSTDDSQQASDPTHQLSTLGQKSGITKQMERFLGALSRADSSLLSSLMQEAKSSSASLASQGSLQSADHVESIKEDLYDPSSPTDDHADSLPFIGINRRKPMQRQNKPDLDDFTEDDLLPHERALQDGSGFSKIVGMKYGIDPTTENQFPFEEMAACSKQRLSSDDVFVEDKSLYNLSEERYDPFCEEETHPSELFTPRSHARGSNAEDDQISERQVALKKCRAEDTLGPVLGKSKDNPEDVDSKEGQYQKLQDLLQTIGLHLDTTEVDKLADRTRERLYGKKTKPQRASCHSLDKKDEKASRYVRRGSSTSTNSDEDVSVSPAKSSKREVYMSYLDSIRHSRGETAVNESELGRLKRTISNNPDVRQVTSESSPQITPTSYEPSLSAQTQTSMYTLNTSNYNPAEQYSWGLNYASNTNQNTSLVQPYSVAPQHNQQIALSYQMPYSYLPPSYNTYGSSNNPPNIMSPNAAQRYQSVALLPTPGFFGTSPTSTHPSVSVQFDTGVLSCRSDYTTQQAAAKPTIPHKVSGVHRYLTQIKTVSTTVKPPAQLLSIEESHKSNLVEKQEPQHTNTEVEAPASLIAEDDIKAKQKKRLEQFNQRMRQKKEQQMEALRIRGEGKKLLPENTQKEVKNVWICGHSLIFWAEKRATSPELGMQLGMHPNTVRIWWKGVQGMTWEQLLPQVHQLKDNWPKPDVILIHLGGNDIGKSTPEDFVGAVQKDLISLKSIFPQCLLVWSDILPRKFWRHSDDSPTVNETRAAINIALHDILLSLGGSSLTHENIKSTLDSGFYRPDGVHLSGKGIDTFNLNMQDFLEKWEHEINKAETSKG